jgi:hypothetical protein
VTYQMPSKTLAIDHKHAEARFYNAMSYVHGADEVAHARIEFARFLNEFADHRLAERANVELKKCDTKLNEPTEGPQP